MAEYKGKLLRGLFTQAKNVLFGDGTDAQTFYDKSEIVKLEGTTAGLDASVNLQYPAGFGVDNTVVIRVDVLVGSYWSDMINGAVGVQIAYSANDFRIYTRLASFASCPYRVYIRKK